MPAFKRIVTAAAIALAVLMLAALWIPGEGPPTPEKESIATLRPSDTRRAKQRRANAETAAPTPTATDGEPTPPHTLSVVLGPDEQMQRNFQMIPGFGPSHWFPGQDEAPLPETPAADALQGILDLEGKGEWGEAHDAAVDAFLDLAEADGLLDTESFDEPWHALLAMEALRREDDRNWQIEAEKWGPTSAYIPERVWPDHHLDGLYALADDVREANRGEAVGDFATLYALHARSEGGNVEIPDVQMALDVLAESPDDLVAEAAVMALPALLHGAGVALESSDIRPIRGVFRNMEGTREKMSVAMMVLDHAVYTGNRADIAWWMDGVDDALEGLCVLDGRSCEMYSGEIDAITGQLAMASQRAPQNWQQALSATVWTCYRDGAFLEDGESLVGKAVWDGHWRWEAWSDAGEMSACIDASPPGEPLPEAGTRVELSIR